MPSVKPMLRLKNNRFGALSHSIIGGMSIVLATAFTTHAAPLPSANVTADYDAVVVINESTLNKFLQAIGPITGGGTFNNGRSSYTWTVTNPVIRISKGGSAFTADANIRSGLLDYGTNAKGDVDVHYDQVKNVISVKIRKASFEIALDLFGNRIHIADIDISAFYRPKFEFPGPKPLQSNLEIDMPNKGTKPIQIKTVVKNLVIEPGRIIVGSNFVFSSPTPTANKKVEL